MATNTSQLKSFAQNTRNKLISLITTKLHYLLNADNAELRGWEPQINKLRQTISANGEKNVIEEVAYTWFNRVMALRYMDARGFNTPMVVSVAEGQTRPQILEEAMAGSIDDSLSLKDEDKLLEGVPLYRRLLIAVCNNYNESMPFLFERLADYTEMLLPDDLLSNQSFITDIRSGMSDEDYQNVEIMGWLYQFYITDRKAEAEKNKSRRGGLKSDEQAAATQLFTPHWIVRYMVENSLGRIWMTLHPESDLVNSMPYYIAPVEGQVDVIPEGIKAAEDIRFLDPCMGSGHILVYAFDLFAKMYEEEGKSTKEIPVLIIKNNLFGIDIDRRCYQLASFALTMKAREYYRRYLRNTVMPNVIALEPIDRQTIESTGNWSKDSLVWQMENLDTIGSLLKITSEECNAIRVGDGIFVQTQKLMKEEAEYLSRSYHCVVTNPPYLGKGIGDELKSYIANIYPNTKVDTMATFMERCRDFCSLYGKWAMINMHSWMFNSSYEKIRKEIISPQPILSGNTVIGKTRQHHIDSLLHLGPHAFNEISGEKVQNAAFVITTDQKDGCGIYYRLIDYKNSESKENAFLTSLNKYVVKDQTLFEKIPSASIAYWANENILKAFVYNPLSEVAPVKKGMDSGNNSYFFRLWFEVAKDNFGIRQNQNSFKVKWAPLDKGGRFSRWYGNNEWIVNWENDGEELRNSSANLRSERFYFSDAITWNSLTTGKISFRLSNNGAISNTAGSSLYPDKKEYLLGLLNSIVCQTLVDFISPTLNYSAGPIGAIPIINNPNLDIIENVRNNITISKQDWDAHETSWDFQTNELVRIAKDKGVKSLQTILAYYIREWAAKFDQLHDNEEELNRKFIEIYGLQDELTPDVPLNEVTILQKGEISFEDGEVKWHEDEIIKQFISYLVGCFMGRYSIERPGLVIANQGQQPSDLDFTPTTIEIDDDGIIPIIQEADFFADDMTYRVESAIESLFGKENKDVNLNFIKDALGCSLRDYFFKNYYNDHLAMYSVKGSKRPIYWLFSSKMGEKKKKGYFKALVYMHRMESDTLSKLHADYVVPYLNKLDRQLKETEDELSRDDIFNRKKVLTQYETLRDKIREVREFADELAKMASHRQTIDLDDGVAVNYPKFYPLLEPVKFPKQSD